ncbi:mitochondrial protein C2orf69 homolog isoform X2 [Leptidea sinapis]|uniref:mitochondrial protein C2orf69 homolog isoform X2 n=1 Tax=Leptidea sinapis TaxID=189913 RepID=UPI0021C28B8F|nr:mitochondrial protein C2orf69 homolog isoform X2 [Leptidea sinapis]
MLPIRVRRVVGHERRDNDVLFHPARQKPASPETLVFFGGDVQDYEEVMQTHRDNRNYLKWSLENTARMLSDSFPTKHIVVVRPSRIEYKSFSCYDNFVPSNNAGVPDHTPTHSALHHLEKLLQEVSSRVKELPVRELCEAVVSALITDDDDIEITPYHSNEAVGCSKSNGSSKAVDTAPTGAQSVAAQHKQDLHPLWWRESLALDDSQLCLVGFSKGCVVLNQLIYEFHYTKTLTPWDAHVCRFIDRIESMYWLDGGHAGGKNTWITSRSLLETLTRLDLRVFVHVSGYQVRDEARPWIAREEKCFSTLLRKLGANIQRFMHDEGGTHSLTSHFDVLANFKKVQESRPADPQDSSEDEA